MRNVFAFIQNIGKTLWTTSTFYLFKMLGNIISMMYQSMKNFTEGKYRYEGV